jgi:hypothetical protein
MLGLGNEGFGKETIREREEKKLLENSKIYQPTRK